MSKKELAHPSLDIVESHGTELTGKKHCSMCCRFSCGIQVN